MPKLADAQAKPRLLNRQMIVDLVNENKGLRSFLKTFLRGSAAKNSHFTAEDYREMLNSNIGNVFQRMVYTGITKIAELNELIKEQAATFLHQLEVKKAVKHAHAHAHDNDVSYQEVMDIDQDAPKEQIIPEKIDTKKGLLASSLEILSDKLYKMQLRLSVARNRYNAIFKEYQAVVENHHQEYFDLASREELRLTVEHVAQLFSLYHLYHSDTGPAHRQQVVRDFANIAPIPVPRNANVDEVHERLHKFFDAEHVKLVMRRHAADHSEYRDQIQQSADNVIYYQQATIGLQSELNQTLRLWQMKNPNFEYTPKPGSKANADQEEEVKLANWPPKYTPKLPGEHDV